MCACRLLTNGNKSRRSKMHVVVQNHLCILFKLPHDLGYAAAELCVWVVVVVARAHRFKKAEMS
jgi:hypothetical protein